jgi:hypothetical protein
LFKSFDWPLGLEPEPRWIVPSAVSERPAICPAAGVALSHFISGRESWEFRTVQNLTNRQTQ